MVKKSRSGMNIPYHFSESILGLKIFKFFDADPGSGIFLALDPGSGIEKFGSGTTSRFRNTGLVILSTIYI
jgi:hypothetical protein